MRLIILLLLAGYSRSLCRKRAQAQDDPNEAPLGDVARSFRKKIPASEVVIDNDNFSKVVEEAESRRAAGLRWCFRSIPEPRISRLPRPGRQLQLFL